MRSVASVRPEIDQFKAFIRENVVIHWGSALDPKLALNSHCHEEIPLASAQWSGIIAV